MTPRPFVLTLALALALAATRPLPAQTVSSPSAEQETRDDHKRVRFVWDDRPSLRVGGVFRLDVRARFQGDWRTFSPEQAPEEGLFELHRRRAGVQGTLLRHFEYEVERELRRKGPWRDAFVNVRYFDNVQIQGGKFKVPFSLDEVTGTSDLDFVFRTLIANNLAPARDVGVMAHGRFFRRGLGYQVGAFKRDGENARITEPFFLLPDEEPPRSERSVAGRVTARPLRLTSAPAAFRDLEIGAAVTWSTVPDGLNSLRGRTVFRYPFFPRVYVRGRRVRIGTELNWSPGPLSLKGEYIRASDDRRRQGLGDEDLPDLVASGWYLSATWMMAGAEKAGARAPRKEFPLFGFGAVEAAVRYETLRFGSSEHPGPSFRNPRAANIFDNSDRVWTLGGNWYLNRWAKIQGNAIRERIEDLERSPIVGRKVFWSGVLRLQFAL